MQANEGLSLETCLSGQPECGLSALISTWEPEHKLSFVERKPVSSWIIKQQIAFGALSYLVDC